MGKGERSMTNSRRPAKFASPALPQSTARPTPVAGPTYSGRTDSHVPPREQWTGRSIQAGEVGLAGAAAVHVEADARRRPDILRTDRQPRPAVVAVDVQIDPGRRDPGAVQVDDAVKRLPPIPGASQDD